MSDWTRQPIKDLIESQWPGEWGSEHNPYVPSVVVYRSTDIDDEGHLLEDNGGVYRGLDPKRISTKKLLPGDILLEASGGTPDRPVGRVALFSGTRSELSVCANFLRTLRPKKIVCAEYLKWVLYSLHRQPAIWRYQQQTTGIINLKVVDYLNHPVDLPPLPQQRRIAEILSTLDEAIEQTEALIAKMQQVKAGMMHDLFTRGVTPAGRLRPTREQAPELYKESSLGWIPKEWEVRKLGEIAEVNRGKFSIRPRNDPRFYGGEYPFIQTGDVSLAQGRVLSTYSQTLNAAGLAVSRLFEAGTIMVTIAANIADTCILGVPMCAPDSLVGVQANQGQITRFLELCIRRQKDWFEARAPQTAQKNINLEDLRPLLIPAPTFQEQDIIAAIYENIDISLATSEQEIEKLRQKKHGLMHDLLNGRRPLGLESASGTT